MIGQQVKKLLFGGFPIFLFLVIYTIVTLVLSASSPNRNIMAYSGQEDFSFRDGWTDAIGNEIDPGNLTDAAEQSGTDDFILYHTLPELDSDTYLSFYSYGAWFRLLVDDEVIYSYQYRPIVTAGHAYGTDFHNIRIPRSAGGRRLTLEVQMIYDAGASFLDLSLGQSSAFLVRFLRQMLPSFILSLMIIGFGTLILITAKSISADRRMLRSIKAFATLSIGIGIWSMIETQVLTLLYGHAELFRSYDYLILMLLPYPMAVMANGWVDVSSERFERLIRNLVLTNIVLAIALRMEFHLDLHQLYFLIHGVLLISFFGSVAIVIRNVRLRYHDGMTLQRIRIWAGLAIFFTCALLDLIRYNQNHYRNIDAAQFTRIGFLFLMYFFLAQYMVESKLRMRVTIEAETYRQMAYEDKMTGVGNRAAFEAKEKDLNLRLKESDLTVVVVSIDMNHLKIINDTYGHAAGDDYIQACAQLLKHAFAGSGMIYRVGGDEFMVIIEGRQAEQTYANCARRLKECNPVSPGHIRPSFAMGYEVIRSSDGRSLEAAEAVADARMYQNKIEMKAVRKD